MRLLTTALGLALSYSLLAQFPYTLEASSSPYEEFSDGAIASPGMWDDPFINFPLGFEFEYFGQTSSVLYQTGSGSWLTTSFGALDAIPLLIPYYSDLMDASVLEGMDPSTISYKTTGSAPNRVFHLQWKDCGFYSEIEFDSTADNLVNFQLRVYEGSNDIAIHFGPHSISDSFEVHNSFGPSILLGDVSGDYYNPEGTLYFLTGSPDDPGIVEFEVADGYTGSIGWLNDNPSDGTLYYLSSGTVDVDESHGIWARFFPNPTEGLLKVDWPQAIGNQHFKIQDLTGKEVMSGELSQGAQPLDLSALPDGMYLLRAASDRGMLCERIIVSR